MYGQPIHSLFSVNHDHCIIQGSIYEIYKSKYKLLELKIIRLHWCETIRYWSHFKFFRFPNTNSFFAWKYFILYDHILTEEELHVGGARSECNNVSVYRFYKTLQLLNFPGFVFSKKYMLCIKRKAKEMNVKTFDQS